jgi:enhancing lycopene biosynthesis protein 2
MQENLLDYATGLYGQTLDAAQTHELILILSAVALEMECRHITAPTSKTMEQLHHLIGEADDRDIMTLGVAAALCLRVPKGDGGVRLSIGPLLTPAAA